MLIREALPEDCPGIARVQVDSYRTAYAGMFPDSYLARFTYEEQTQDWQEWLVTHPDDVLLVALSPEEQVIGYLLARAEPDIYPGYDAEILAMHVDLAHQEKGIGKALLWAAVASLKGRGCRSVMLWTLKNNPVRKWYERLEGKFLGEKRFQVDGWDIVEVAYGWEAIATLQFEGEGP
jgi:ribosomal protein S18 acetylase RimI-like enzyme